MQKVVAALAYEQDKRHQLAHIDEALILAGLTRADIPSICPAAAHAGWERQLPALRQVYAALQGRVA